MKTITLEFDGYWKGEKNKGIPSQSGVYCVYVCEYNEKKDEYYFIKLIYIGESSNVKDRIADHDRLDEWLEDMEENQSLWFSFAPVSSEDREMAEAALIFEAQPPYNTEHTKEFIYNDTEIKTSGKNYKLPTYFTVKKGEKK